MNTFESTRFVKHVSMTELNCSSVIFRSSFVSTYALPFVHSASRSKDV
jgi:hypothetical protein